MNIELTQESLERAITMVKEANGLAYERQVSLSHWGIFIEISEPMYAKVYGQNERGELMADLVRHNRIIGYRPLNSFDVCAYENKFEQIERIKV